MNKDFALHRNNMGQEHHPEDEHGKKEHEVVFVNRHKCTLEASKVQVKTLLKCGGAAPDEKYELQRRNGEGGPIVETFTDPEQYIEVKDGEHFTTRLIGPINPS